MAHTVIMPKLGQATEESTIVKWHKREGDTVSKGDILFEMETDKAVLEAESFFEGTLLKILVPEGVTVPVNMAVAFIGAPGENLPDVPTPQPAATATVVKPGGKTTPPASPPSSASLPVAPAASSPPPTPPAAGPGAPPPPDTLRARRFLSPRARSLARARVIDPSPILGTGPGGRVVEKDVIAYLDARDYAAIRISAAAKNLASTEGVDILSVRGTGESGRILVRDVERAVAERPRPLTRMRRVIAQRLTQSFTTTPHIYVTVTADMTDLLAYRAALKARGEPYTVTDFILEAVILSLKEFPTLNSSTDGQVVRWRGCVDLGVAVGLDDGLVVPVIRRAEELGFRELHDAAAALATKAREGKLLPDEMTGSSFTVSNMGMMDVENFGAIINPGEAAILAVASTLRTPAVRDGSIVQRDLMKMTLSGDHRIVDGMAAARFVNAVRRKLEDMELWKSLT